MLCFIRTIYRNFIAKGAVHELTLSAKVAHTAKSFYEQIFSQSCADATSAIAVQHMLDWLGPVWHEVFTLVAKDTWFRFRKTGDYTRFKAYYRSMQGHLTPTA
jgi:hypothetical protein